MLNFVATGTTLKTCHSNAVPVASGHATKGLVIDNRKTGNDAPYKLKHGEDWMKYQTEQESGVDKVLTCWFTLTNQ